MTCHEIEARLDDWVDDALPEASRREVADHLAACPHCRGRERGLRDLLTHAAALPRSVSPPRDLWPGIAARIERQRVWSWPRLVGWPQALAVAAAVVVALGAVFLGRPSPTPVHTVVIPTPGPAEAVRPRPAALEMEPGLAAMESDYQAAATALLDALQKRKDDLDPDTLAGIQHNLAVIDEALAEVHRALEKDPNRPELGRMLVSTHRKRVEALRRMVKLSSALSTS